MTELGATLLRNGKPGEASEELDRALLIDPTHVDTRRCAVGAAALTEKPSFTAEVGLAGADMARGREADANTELAHARSRMSALNSAARSATRTP